MRHCHSNYLANIYSIKECIPVVLVLYLKNIVYCRNTSLFVRYNHGLEAICCDINIWSHTCMFASPPFPPLKIITILPVCIFVFYNGNNISVLQNICKSFFYNFLKIFSVNLICHGIFTASYTDSSKGQRLSTTFMGHQTWGKLWRLLNCLHTFMFNLQ